MHPGSLRRQSREEIPDVFKGLAETTEGILDIGKAKDPAVADWKKKFTEIVCEPIPLRTM